MATPVILLSPCRKYIYQLSFSLECGFGERCFLSPDVWIASVTYIGLSLMMTSPENTSVYEMIARHAAVNIDQAFKENSGTASHLKAPVKLMWYWKDCDGAAVMIIT